jgi:cell fate (sporulation/competence/biofilm development) regulator YmcA (YheA/YmcA/DUF963 family)
MKYALAILLIALTACRSTYYSVQEKFGREKRDILRSRVVDARDEQKEASAQFKTALERMKEMYGFEGGKLEAAYVRFKGEYEDCREQADQVRSRIKSVETVAGDLFKEWEAELKQISDVNLRTDSRRKLDESRQKYDQLHASMKRAEAGMDPILGKFNDNVLYLKHNLNAQAIGALRGESLKIEGDIAKLIADMNTSIAQAEEFIRSLK